ncbi:MAG: hypothetical protein AB9835_08895 [Eubacteriales bacterium]
MHIVSIIKHRDAVGDVPYDVQRSCGIKVQAREHSVLPYVIILN